MKRDLGSLPPRVAAAMAEREEERKPAYRARFRGKNDLVLEDYVMAAARGVFTILGNGKISAVIIPGRSGDA